ncbi:hypothetical protein GIB23_15625 [Pseudomonas putida]|uniref:hypothetical protein n=1 Tax=Pseudomonas putida TaxID=303 RepID=UPI001A8F747F|nr:hypothetical protein [Pseudomonas putida]MBO0368516.1 hypothetical protein [Pseudomonas putida]
MSDYMFKMIEPGVLKFFGSAKGPDCTVFRGREYFRFMDFFYTHTPYLDELDADDVSHLCRARAKYPELISEANTSVRELFKKVALELSPKTFLEIGAGSHPIFGNEVQARVDYVISDADPEVVQKFHGQGIQCQVFSNAEPALNYPDNHFELVMAVFVLHFPFYTEQITELHRTMSMSGAMIANVYRRTSSARDKLLADLKREGLKVHRVQDAKGLCKEHEHWIIGKDLDYLKHCGNILTRLDTV